MALSSRKIKATISEYFSERGRTASKTYVDGIFREVTERMTQLNSDNTVFGVREALAHVLMQREETARKKFEEGK